MSAGRDLLAGYVPGRDGPFGFDEAAHLARRAGFSLPARDVDELAALGPEAAVDRLFGGALGATPDEGPDEGGEARAIATQSAIVTQSGFTNEDESLPKLQALWLARMATTRAPAVEKLALFWHGHFATSFEKVKRTAWMWEQYRLFREHGAGSFRDLLLAVARDPAMLVWLDSNSNERGRPNENFAREVMELFSLGVGNYREKDIQEAARAFSGWHLKDGVFWLNERAHDGGEKEVFGRRGNLDGRDVVDLCVAQPACPRFLATKLLRFYVTPMPSPAQVDELSAVLLEEKLVVGAALRRLFLSKAFYDPAVRGRLIGSPVDWCIGLLRRTRGRARWVAVAAATSAMGQALFLPPNVKGWDGDRAWINSRTLLERARFATALAYGGGDVAATISWNGLLPSRDHDDPVRMVGALAKQLLQSPLSSETAARLVDFARGETQGGEAGVRRVAHLLLTAPDAQLV
jgi:uncharacterized protein (DUF1800 family)